MEIERLIRCEGGDVERINTLISQLSDHAPSVDAERIAHVLESSDIEFIVARENGVILGMALLVIIRKLEGDEANVQEVVVDEEARGKGVGRALMEAIIARAKERGVSKIELTSRPSRVAAHALYVKLGFEKAETNVFRLRLA